MSLKVQSWVHFIEEGPGARAIQFAAAMLAFIALAVLYDIGSFKNFNTEEAMDTAQLARNISQGKGYTTDYIRLISVTLVQSRANNRLGNIQQTTEDKTRLENQQGALIKQAELKLNDQQSELIKLATLRKEHPDLANAPAYPVLLGGLMKVAPIDYKIAKGKPFSIYKPELWIAVLNQMLFFLSVMILFKITRQLFDLPTAFISALLFAVTELFWRFSISGLPTMLMVFIFLCVAWSLLQFERATGKTPAYKLIFWGLLTGVLVGTGCLTRYSFGWLIGPAVFFFLFFGKAHRLKVCFAALAAFFLVVSPWLARNYSLSGNLFGTAIYAVCENTPAYPEDRLDRSLNPGSILGKVAFGDYVRKFAQNSRDIFQNEIPRLGGSWLTLFFIVGLFSPQPSSARSRLRAFVLLSMVFLWLPQALGRTHLTNESPQINSENLLLLLSPLLFAFGVALYFSLVRRINFPEPIFFYVTTLLFCIAISSPMILTLLPPKSTASAYPPYHPPLLQETASWMRQNELMMSDVPWAVAWYGDRPCVSLTLTHLRDFFRVNDDIKPVLALYLTPRTMDIRLLSQIIKDREGWGQFIFGVFSKGELPNGFPLKKAPPGFLPDQIFLTDWERWTVPAKTGASE